MVRTTPGSLAASSPWAFIQQNPGAAFFCTLLVLGVIGISSLFKSLQLRDGGGVVARSLGGGYVASATPVAVGAARTESTAQLAR